MCRPFFTALSLRRLFLAFAMSVAAFPLANPALAAAASERDPLIQLLREYESAVIDGRRADIARWLHPHYTYTESDGSPSPATSPLEQRLASPLRRTRFQPQNVVMHVVDSTAVIAGTCLLEELGRYPRFEARGQFSMTWVKSGDAWLLLAEHRSMNRQLEWAPELSSETLARLKTEPPAPRAALPPPIDADPDGSALAPSTADNPEIRVHRGILPKIFTDLFRAYEPNKLGYTWDRGDDGYMDFTFSTMFPVWPGSGDYPDAIRLYKGALLRRPLYLSAPKFYVAGTVRAGQYIGTRPSSPVVGKRFNPLLAVRFWAEDAHRQTESEDNFLEVVYGHESNGQFIANEERFKEQLGVFEKIAGESSTPAEAERAKSTAFRSARDHLSRGWDYLGFQFARDWDANLPFGRQQEVTMGLRLRFNYYLSDGIAQGRAEQYKHWEGEAVDRPRKNYDGLSFRYTLTVAPPRKVPAGWHKLLRLDRRYTLTWTTGYRSPFRKNTVQGEASVTLFDTLPFTLWARYGYNSDLIDYYRRDHSVGLSLSYWSF
jgi:hypothetical protein